MGPALVGFAGAACPQQERAPERRPAGYGTWCRGLFGKLALAGCGFLCLLTAVVEGFTVQRGFVSPYMVTDAKRMEAVYDKPAIVVTDKKVSSAQEFVPLLEMIAQSGKKDLVLIGGRC